LPPWEGGMGALTLAVTRGVSSPFPFREARRMSSTNDADTASRHPRPDKPRDLTLTVLGGGGGLMGHSIAGVFALAGATVSVYDTVQPVLDSVPDRVAEQLERRGARTDAASTIRLSSDLHGAVADADLVIEAVPEQLELKQNLFQRIGEWLPTAVLATNSSVLRTADIAARTRPDQLPSANVRRPAPRRFRWT
jgi:NADPH-dependent 2,4-dienoyl-CoA reductase/sulfur reductase-like enzyme